MWTRSADCDRAVRSGGVPFLNRVSVTTPSGAVVDIPHERVASGSVAITAAQGVRRTLTLSVVNTGIEWAALEPAGAWLSVSRGPLFWSGAEYLPMGRFRVDVEAMDYSDGLINLTCPDRWVVIQESTFETAERPRADTFIHEIVRLLQPGGTAVRVLTSRDAPLPRAGIVYTDSREAAIYGLAQVVGVDVAYAADGVAEIRDLPTHPRAVAWMVDHGQNGVLVSVDRSRTRQYSFNRITVVASSTSGAAPFLKFTVEDLDPTSPTFVNGPFGAKPKRISSDLVTSSQQAKAMATAALPRFIGLQSQVTWTAIGHPALDVLDSVGVVFGAQPGMNRVAEAHVLDTLTQPLDGSPMQGTCRAVGPATSDPALSRTYIDADAEAGSYTALNGRYASYTDLLAGRVKRGVQV